MPTPGRNDNLSNIKLVNPCTSDWDSMIGNDRVRFCDHCHMHVHNLSEMTAAQAIELVGNSKGRLCARYILRPDGVIQTSDIGEYVTRVRFRSSKIAAGAFTAALSLGSSIAVAQTTPPDSEVNSFKESMAARDRAPSKLLPGTSRLSGSVLDARRASIPKANLTLTLVETGATRGMVADEAGEYVFESLTEGSYTLSASSNGFKKTEVTHIDLTGGSDLRIDVELEVGQELGGAIAIVTESKDPVFNAVIADEIDQVKNLLISGATANFLDVDLDETALLYSTRRGDLDMVTAVLAGGADPNLSNSKGEAPLMLIHDEDGAKLIPVLVNAGATVNQEDHNGDTALTRAARNSNPEIVKALLDAGAFVNAANHAGKTALMIAAKESEDENVSLIIAAGADVNLVDREGKSALAYAREEEKNDDVVEMLLAHGARE
jgi:hypothetical protein